MKSQTLCFLLSCLLLVLTVLPASAVRRSRYFNRQPRNVDARFSYFGGGPLLVEYEEYSGVADRSSSGGFQLVGGLQWDYVGLEARLAPGSVAGGNNQYSFKFESSTESLEMELDNRLYILGKPALPLGPVEEPYGWIYGLVGPGFGGVKTKSDTNTTGTYTAANEADLVYGVGFAMAVDQLIFQLDIIRNLDQDDSFSGVYFGLHHRFK